MEDDKELILLENYLLKLRFFNDLQSKNNIDFGFLTFTPKMKQPIKQQQSFQKEKEFFSFNGKKQSQRSKNESSEEMM